MTYTPHDHHEQLNYDNRRQLYNEYFSYVNQTKKFFKIKQKDQSKAKITNIFCIFFMHK